MTRVSKEYKFNLGAEAKVVKFSSYPGFSYSFDDWYSLDTGIQYFETTQSPQGDNLYVLCSEQSLMTWIRAPIAGRLAKDAEHFSTIISKYNSGTYNNQWVVVDLKQFETGEQSNVLWIQEQIPGKSAAYDATARLLSEGYFPSYNIPSLQEMRIVEGYVQAAKLNFTKDYEHCPRAEILRRDSKDVKALTKWQNS